MVVRKTPLEKLTGKRSDSINYQYTTTIKDCHKWFKILNEEIFGGQLSPIENIDIRWRRGYHGRYDPTKNRLELNKKYRSKRFFVQVLAHELIHHYQYTSGLSTGHNKEFFKWKKKFNRKGMKLSRCYDEETD